MESSKYSGFIVNGQQRAAFGSLVMLGEIALLEYQE